MPVADLVALLRVESVSLAAVKSKSREFPEPVAPVLEGLGGSKLAGTSLFDAGVASGVLCVTSGSGSGSGTATGAWFAKNAPQLQARDNTA